MFGSLVVVIIVIQTALACQYVPSLYILICLIYTYFIMLALLSEHLNPGFWYVTALQPVNYFNYGISKTQLFTALNAPGKYSECIRSALFTRHQSDCRLVFLNIKGPCMS